MDGDRAICTDGGIDPTCGGDEVKLSCGETVITLLTIWSAAAVRAWPEDLYLFDGMETTARANA